MFEMYFAEAVDPQKLCDVVARHLFVRREDVAVVPLTQVDTKDIAVVVEDVGGDFPLGITVYVDLLWLQVSEVDLAQKLCASLQNKCLVSDNGDNPYRWLLVTADSVQAVMVNPQLFDGQCVFQIDEMRSL